jgi:hypothetical protein
MRWSSHARQRSSERGVTSAEVEAVLRNPDIKYPGNQGLGRTVFIRTLSSGRMIKVVAIMTDNQIDSATIVTVVLMKD